MHQNHLKRRNRKFEYIISTPDGEYKGEAISKYNTSEWDIESSRKNSWFGERQVNINISADHLCNNKYKNN